MQLPIQASPVEVPCCDPFRNDLLGREQHASKLTKLLKSVQTPCVVAIDAAWGDGKTTLINMWARQLKNEHFRVINYNAWETDFTDDPFLALSEEIVEQLSDYKDTALSLAALRRTASTLMKEMMPSAVSFALSMSPIPFVGLTGPAIQKLLGHWLDNRQSSYSGQKTALKDFRQKLESVASISSAGESLPLVIFIDELDRCRPNYAVQLLEVIKHVCSVPGIVFVLAINREQLALAVQGMYGESYDGSQYLERFFDMVWSLPHQRDLYVGERLKKLGIFQSADSHNESLQVTREPLPDPVHWPLNVYMASIFDAFLPTPPFSTRRIEQTLLHFNLVCNLVDLEEARN